MCSFEKELTVFLAVARVFITISHITIYEVSPRQFVLRWGGSEVVEVWAKADMCDDQAPTNEESNTHERER